MATTNLSSSNLSRALTLVHTGQVERRSDLTERLGLTRTGAGGVLRQLDSLELVHTLPGRAERPAGAAATTGRPSPMIRIHPRAPVAIAVQIQGDRVVIATARLGGGLEEIVETALPRPATPEAVLPMVADLLEERLSGLELPCVGIGVAAPSAVGAGGVALSALPLQWPANVPVAGRLRALLAARGRQNLEVAVDNDANLAALAESRHGAGRGARHMLFLGSWPHGVGGGLVIDGRLHTGSAGYALEVGHITVDFGGRKCHCGNTGCLEMHVTPAALVESYVGRPHGGAPTAMAQAVLAAAATDPRARRAVDGVIDYLAIGLGALINILNPDRIVLGELHADLLRADRSALVDAVSRRSYLDHASQVDIVPALLPRPGLAGAAELAFQPLLDDPHRQTRVR